ncbi:hypothetical protein G6L68_23095 [Agrobacterium fabrum]|uniref:hypothetical protein n=1 Tax=Agrobacterium fabrum TaxID=1176649 RepID=UPI000EF5D380|nr:hypothetical protein [Agrobacterium fabrum]AYM66010.1 hypothetical protein At12D13_48580 [Agrobacterium fabrum]NTE63539.1 hypothetical protein [Agrobacterium fabrum]
MTSKHPKTRKPTDRDLRKNPGIGTSKGATEAKKNLDEEEDLLGDNTFEGDVANDVTPQGGINPGQTGRTNK